MITQSDAWLQILVCTWSGDMSAVPMWKLQWREVERPSILHMLPGLAAIEPEGQGTADHLQV